MDGRTPLRSKAAHQELLPRTRSHAAQLARQHRSRDGGASAAARLAQRRQRGRPDAPGRPVDNALEGRVVALVAQQARIAQQVLRRRLLSHPVAAALAKHGAPQSRSPQRPLHRSRQ